MSHAARASRLPSSRLAGCSSAASGWEYAATSVAPGWAVWSTVLMWVLVLEALRRAGGWVLLGIMAVFSLFPIFSGWMPPPLSAPSVGLLDTADHVVEVRAGIGGAYRVVKAHGN